MFGVHRSVALAIENAPLTMTQCMHNKIDREWNEDVGEIFLRFIEFYWDFYERFYS